MAVITVTNRLIDITVSGGDTEVKFDRSYQRFALKSEDALSLKDAENEYKTSDGNGVARMNFGVGTDTITVSGSGSGRLWAGMSFDDCPFVNAGKGGGSSFIGVTTTAITDGSTTSPITIDGKSVTPKMGDVVIYNQTEFLWDGSKWNQFGNPIVMDTTPTIGSENAVTSGGIANLIRKGSTTNAVRMGSSTSSGTYTLSQGDGSSASGYAACAINNGKASGNYTFAQGTGTTASQTNMAAFGKHNSVVSGDLFEIGNGTSSNARSNIVEVSSTYLNVNGDLKKNGVALGSLSMQSSASGSYTPEGSVAVTPTTSSISAVVTVGTLPSMIYDSANESITFDPGTLPTTSSETVMTGASAAFTGTAGTVTVS